MAPELKLTRTMWGVLDASKEDDRQPARWDALFARLRSDGYAAIEACVGPFNPFAGQASALRELLARHGLEFIAQVHTCGYPIASRVPADHVASLRAGVRDAREYGAAFVNAHSGCDSWALADSVAFFRACLEVEAAEGLKVVHETHRQRTLYNPWVTRDVLAAVPDLKVTADLSHWVVVGERIFDDALEPEWPAALAAAAARCHHTHARVGYAQGPQVPDPAAAAHRAELAAHERWWHAVWAAQARRGDRAVYVEPEHGPPPYLHTAPGTGEPVTDLWEANDFLARRVQAHFAAWAAADSDAGADDAGSAGPGAATVTARPAPP